LKQLQGNPGHRPLNKRQPQPKSAVKRPHGLGRGLQRRFWDEHAGELERLHVLTGVDTAAFRLMAEHYAIAVQAVTELRDGGLTVEGKDGTKKNPLAQVFKDNSIAFKAFAVEFGMTPSARVRLKLPEEAEQLSLAEQLFRAVGAAVSNDD
jgi:P27 family predicted phage terminase small subunit